MSSEEGHAFFAPSSAHRWIECTGSMDVTLGDKQSSHPAGYAGTVMHRQYEHIMATGNRRAWTGEEEAALWEARFNPSQAHHIVKLGVQATRKLIRMTGVRHYWLERTVFPGLSDDDYWGTADFIGWNVDSGVLVVADLKTGSPRYPIRPNNNEQMLSYALGAMQALSGIEFERIILAILQPQCNQNKPLTCVVTRDTIDAFADKASRAIGEAQAGDFRFRPSISRCRFCPRSRCEYRIKC